MKKILILCLSIVFIFIFTACGNEDTPDTSERPGDTTVSQGQFFESTESALQKVFIGILGYTDATQEGDNVKVTPESPGFKFECHGLDSSQKLYVFIDGNIDDIAGAFDVGEDTDMCDGEIKVREHEMGEGQHTVQFVQFDGDKIIYCVTRHYEVVFEG